MFDSNIWNSLTVCKEMSCGLFKILPKTIHLQIIYLIFIYKENLILQGLICQKPQSTNNQPTTIVLYPILNVAQFNRILLRCNRWKVIVESHVLKCDYYDLLSLVQWGECDSKMIIPWTKLASYFIFMSKDQSQQKMNPRLKKIVSVMTSKKT